MAEDQRQKEPEGDDFVDHLREIQGEYIMLGEIYEKQKGYGQKLSDLMRALQYELDCTISIRPEAIGQPCKEAFLVSESVVVMVDTEGNKFSKPLYRLPPAVIVSVIEECAPELRRLISEKRRTEGMKVKSLERVLRELKKAQATFKQSKRDELEVVQDEETEVEDDVQEDKVESTVAAAPQPQRAPKDAFAFKASFGTKSEVSEIASRLAS